MRHVPALALASLVTAWPASAQIAERLEIAAVTRTDRVSFEGRQNAWIPVGGVSIAYRIWRDLRIEAEVTAASGESRRSHEGDFITFAEPGSTRDEILRQAVIARKTIVQKPGPGFATALAVETRSTGRVNLAMRAGISVRRYSYIEDMAILRVPDGVAVETAETMLPDGAGGRSRGGLLLGIAVPVRIAGPVSVAPELRWVWGGPARVGNNYDEADIGARVSWKF